MEISLIVLRTHCKIEVDEPESADKDDDEDQVQHSINISLIHSANYTKAWHAFKE